jgi:hypothetical protein
LRADNEINPDVLGYIFEKYVNQKQMGAYYTKEDITEYIGKNTILPYILDQAQHHYKPAFEGTESIWNLLKTEPDCYIYEAVRKGVDLPLPPEIAVGVEDVAQRGEWNKPALEEYALPTEIWRETVARRQRYEELHRKLATGQISEVNDLITYNLNICQFVQDAVEGLSSPDALRVFWKVLSNIKVLDPTVGSGAFLFAALNIFEPLYEACLERMQVFLDELDRSGEKHRPEKFKDFREILDQIIRHPNQRYFILKSIIVNNLYGVDIMDEAVEICKLRLFLKLVAQVERVEDIEPLPDIDFNIRAGNTLVGFTNLEEVRRAITLQGEQIRMLSTTDKETLQRIENKAEDINHLFVRFRQQQTELGGEVTSQDKQNLRTKLKDLEAELNRYLAREYAIHNTNSNEYRRWLLSHKPFHWFIDFHGIMKNGGFDIIIGNPPYVEYNKVKKEYSIHNYFTESCGNLFAYTYEAVIKLAHNTGRSGLIIPVASICTDGYLPLRQLLINSGNLIISSFNDRPGKLFDGLEHIRLAIILCHKTVQLPHTIHTTLYNRWQTVERPTLFSRLSFGQATDYVNANSIPKLSSSLERGILSKVMSQQKVLDFYSRKEGQYKIYYTRKLSSYVQILDFIPKIYDFKGNLREPSELKIVTFTIKDERNIFLALMNSNLFYWLITISSDCRNLNKREILSARFDVEKASKTAVNNLNILAEVLMMDLKSNSRMVKSTYKELGELNIQCTYPALSKSIIDKIDSVLSKHYGLTDVELDYIINYDIKYRLSPDINDEED